MGYKESLQAAGATVIAYKTFGDYQGTWLAKVEWNGQIGWVEGFYGSCTFCDAFEGEFGYDSATALGEDFWDGEYRPATQADVDAYETRFKTFGLHYLESNFATQAEKESEIAHKVADCDWDDEYSRILEWVQSVKEN